MSVPGRQRPATTAEHYIWGRLAVHEARVAAAVARRRADDPDPDDAFRGLYLTEDHVDELLAVDLRPVLTDPGRSLLERLDELVTDHGEHRLGRLRRSAGLDDVDVDLLITAMAPDLDRRFERLYAYLHDDLRQHRASIGLALDLAGCVLLSYRDRARLMPGSPLIDLGLVEVQDPDAPYLARTLRVPDRVGAHLIGDDRPHPLVDRAEITDVPVLSEFDPPDTDLLGEQLVWLREHAGTSGAVYAASLLAGAQREGLFVDFSRLGADDVVTAARLLATEAVLRDAILVVSGLDDRVESIAGALAGLPGPTVLIGGSRWDPSWGRTPIAVDVPVPSTSARIAVLDERLEGTGLSELDLRRVVSAFDFDAMTLARSASAARRTATSSGRAVDQATLHGALRAQNTTRLERLARHIEPSVSWTDLVLPAEPMRLLHELVGQVRHRHEVFTAWGMGRHGSGPAGVTALFAGPSGTGKTLAAEVVAADLGQDLYAIDLSSVIDKYIGETEKNLDRVFAEAEGVAGILFFDEADALFGKRSGIGDSKDRYANVEVAYLLQRMESFGGVAILATNLRSNLDEAFTRRLNAVVDFPVPGATERRRIWEQSFGPVVPLSADVDLDFCAAAFELSGGHIRNAALTAAFAATGEREAVAMADVIRGVEVEYRKLGRLCTAAEFGPHAELVQITRQDRGRRAG